MKVFLNEYIHPEALARIREFAEVTDRVEDLPEADAIIVRTFAVTEDIIKNATHLKVIAKHGVGCNTIDLEAAKKYGVPVFNTPEANINSVAELIVGLMLDISRHISFCDAVSSREGFSRIAPPEATGLELTGKTLGLVGMENIARRTAEILKNGFRMQVVGYDPYCTQEQAEKFGIVKYEKLREMLSVVDFVNISVPLTAETTNLLGAEELACMKENAVLVNAARGGIVNEDALYDALKKKQIRAAACDAFVTEPPSGAEKLTTLENFVATPHIGANTEEALYRMGMKVAEELRNVLEGKPLSRRVA